MEDHYGEYRRCKANAEEALKTLPGLAQRHELRAIKATEAVAWATLAVAAAHLVRPAPDPGETEGPR